MHSPSPFSSDRALSPNRSHMMGSARDVSDLARRTALTRTSSTGGGGAADRSFVVPSAASAGTRLAQEIYDEFLVCKICLDAYRSPKCLSCLHTFCEECIENHIASESTYKKYSDYREFTCPLCRKRTQLSTGGVKKLSDNFLVSSLSELVARQRPSRYPYCDICKSLSGKHREAQSKCLDCAKLLCSSCVQLHQQTKVTSNHSLFDVEIEKDIECREHRDEAVRFYCEPCDTCVCVLCTFHEHKDHEIHQFGDAVVRYKADIVALLDGCRRKIDGYDAQLERLNGCDEVIRGAEQKIHDTAIAFIQEIRARERQLIEELHAVYGPECMDCLENRKDLSTQMESLRSTCSLTDVILNGKDIELLLLKKDVMDKLAALGSVEIKPPPPTSSKVIRFIPGSLDFGYLDDEERPLKSSKKRPRWNACTALSADDQTASLQPDSSSDDESDDDDVEKQDSTTQTDSNVVADPVDVGIQTDPAFGLGGPRPCSGNGAPISFGTGYTSSLQKDQPQLARPAKPFTK